MKVNIKPIEKLRLGLIMAGIGGFINAYSYLLFGQRFAAAQSGNVIMLGLSLAQGQVDRLWHFCLPLICFSLGQSLSYALRRLANHRHINVQELALLAMVGLLGLSLISASFWSEDATVACLALFSGIQVDVFSHIKGLPYANVMMTGNVKVSAYLLTRGIAEKNKHLVKQGLEKYAVMASFILGVLFAVWLVNLFGVASLNLVIVFLLLTYLIIKK